MPHLSDRILSDKWGVVHSGAHLFFCFIFNPLIRGSRPHSSNTPPGHRSKSNPHNPVGHSRRDNPTPISVPWSHSVHPRPQCNQWKSFSHPGAAAPRSRCPCQNGKLFHRTSCSCPFCLTALLQWSVVLSYDKV